MYIEAKINATDLVFQRKDEAGVNVGVSDVYLVADYRIEQSPDQQSVYIQLIETPMYMWPPKAVYPVSRMVLIDTTQVPPPPPV